MQSLLLLSRLSIARVVLPILSHSFENQLQYRKPRGDNVVDDCIQGDEKSRTQIILIDGRRELKEKEKDHNLVKS